MARDRTRRHDLTVSARKLLLLNKLFNWRDALVIVKPETLIKRKTILCGDKNESYPSFSSSWESASHRERCENTCRSLRRTGISDEANPGLHFCEITGKPSLLAISVLP